MVTQIPLAFVPSSKKDGPKEETKKEGKERKKELWVQTVDFLRFLNSDASIQKRKCKKRRVALLRILVT